MATSHAGRCAGRSTLACIPFPSHPHPPTNLELHLTPVLPQHCNSLVMRGPRLCLLACLALVLLGSSTAQLDGLLGAVGGGVGAALSDRECCCAWGPGEVASRLAAVQSANQYGACTEGSPQLACSAALCTLKAVSSTGEAAPALVGTKLPGAPHNTLAPPRRR